MEITSVIFYVLFVIQNSVALRNGCQFKYSTKCKLERRVTSLERDMKHVKEKIDEWVNQQHVIQAVDTYSKLQGVRIKRLEEKMESLELGSGLSTSKQSSDTANNGSITIVTLDTAITLMSQNLTSLINDMNQMQSRKIENLMMNVTRVQEELKEQEQISSSLQTQINETAVLAEQFSGSCHKWKEVREMVENMNMSLIEQDIKYNSSIASLEQKVASIESTMEVSSSNIETLFRVQDIFTTLSSKQQDTENLKQDVLNISNTLSDIEKEIINMTSEHMEFFTKAQRLHENLIVQIEAIKWKTKDKKSERERETVNTNKNLEKIHDELEELKVNEINLHKNMFSVMKYMRHLSTKSPTGNFYPGLTTLPYRQVIRPTTVYRQVTKPTSPPIPRQVPPSNLWT